MSKKASKAVAAATPNVKMSAETKKATATGTGKKSQKPGKLPPEIEDIRNNVFVGNAAPAHTSSVDDPNAFASLGVDNAFNLDTFKKEMKITIQSCTPEMIVFDISGIDAPIANAIRRILLSEVPTMAIDKVLLFQNTSLIQDEVLAHRLGLIPIKADPRMFKFVAESKEGKPTAENTTVFTLDVTCTRNKKATETAPPSEKYINSTILSSELKWIPQGEGGTYDQSVRFAGGAAIRPVHPDIVIAKLRPGQQIEAELHVVKGIGKTHAKWSPVSTASYRLLPQIAITKDFTGAAADELVAKCPQKVFDIEDLGGGSKRARVARPRDCSMCRECIRPAGWEEKIQLRRKRDHFIFSIESTGAYTAAELFHEAIKVLTAKCHSILSELATHTATSETSAAAAAAAGASAAKPAASASAAMDEADS